MQTRKIKKNVAGVWQEIKWADIKKGDILRIYERGHLYHDGTVDTFVATSDSYLFKPDSIYHVFEFEAGAEKSIPHTNVHDNVRAGSKIRWRNLKKRMKGTKKEK